MTAGLSEFTEVFKCKLCVVVILSHTELSKVCVQSDDRILMTDLGP